MQSKPTYTAPTDLKDKAACFFRQKSAILGLGLVILATLACSLLDGAPAEKVSRFVIRQNLPTLTPTVKPDLTLTPTTKPDPNAAAIPASLTATMAQPLPEVASPVAEPVQSPTSTAQPSPTLPPVDPPPISNETDQAIPLDPTITPSDTPPPDLALWSFAGVELYHDEFEAGLALYGDVINETGATQELSVIRATFYDGQGQVIGDAGSAVDYWPIDVIPAGARLPFGVLAPEVENTANFELKVEAQPGAQSPHQNFQVLGLAQQQAEFGYCLTGQVQNMGDPLQEYLIVMAVLYDSQNHVVKFGEYYAPDPTAVLGDQLEPFEICIDSVSREVARHEVRVWGE